MSSNWPENLIAKSTVQYRKKYRIHFFKKYSTEYTIQILGPGTGTEIYTILRNGQVTVMYEIKEAGGQIVTLFTFSELKIETSSAYFIIVLYKN